MSRPTVPAAADGHKEADLRRLFTNLRRPLADRGPPSPPPRPLVPQAPPPPIAIPGPRASAGQSEGVRICIWGTTWAPRYAREWVTRNLRDRHEDLLACKRVRQPNGAQRIDMYVAPDHAASFLAAFKTALKRLKFRDVHARFSLPYTLRRQQRAAHFTHRLSVVTWNINSLQSKRDAVRSLLDEQKPDVLVLTETGLRYTDVQFAPRGYRAFHKHDLRGTTNRRGAGITILVRARHYAKIATGAPESDHVLWVSIAAKDTHSLPLLIAGVYIHPSTNAQAKRRAVEKIGWSGYSRNGRLKALVIAAGDWNQKRSVLVHRLRKTPVRALMKTGRQVHTYRHTGVDQQEGGTELDHIAVSAPLKPRGKNGKVLYGYVVSDHYPVTSELAIPGDTRLPPPHRNQPLRSRLLRRLLWDWEKAEAKGVTTKGVWGELVTQLRESMAPHESPPAETQSPLSPPLGSPLNSPPSTPHPPRPPHPLYPPTPALLSHPAPCPPSLVPPHFSLTLHPQLSPRPSPHPNTSSPNPQHNPPHRQPKATKPEPN